MRITDLFEENISKHEFSVIHEQCSRFILESDGIPVLKNLPVIYDDLQKVKVRKRKSTDLFASTFNEAFVSEFPDLRQRAVFACGESSFVPFFENDLEPFYIFLIDDFKFTYSKEVTKSDKQYKQVFDALLEQFGDDGSSVITDLLKFTYTTENLYEGISSGAELIIYNTPYYYAVRQSSINNYSDLLTCT